MGFMDELKKLAKPYAEDEDDYDDYDDGLDEAPPPSGRSARSSAPAAAPAYNFDDLGIGSQGSAGNGDRRNNKVVNIHTTTQLQVVLVKPDRFDNVSEIAEHLREKHAVVLNLEQTSKDIARRLVDFLSGCAYALDGKIKKVAISTYIITPYNVDIVGDLIDELESNGMYV